MTGSASAPASSGNLGPGFDCIALALDLRCTVTARPAAAWEPPAGSLLRAAAEAAVGPEQPLALEVESDIPIGKGLGSSAAVVAAAFVAARRALGADADQGEVLAAVARMEGHADNAAAAVMGGLILIRPDGVAHRLELHPSLRVVVGVPDEVLPTAEARAALPDEVPLGLAARSVARVATLVEGLRTGDVTLLRAVGDDELHEPVRREMRPVIVELVAAARAAGAATAALSGAGPAVLALAGGEEAAAVADALAAVVGTAGVVLRPEVAAAGVG